MGTVNTRVVRRSNALLGHAYGRELRYRELMLGGGLPLGPVKAAAIAGGLGALVAGLSIPPTRRLLDHLLPDPGEGPSEQARERGFFHMDIHTRTSGGAHLVGEIRATGDPGYKATAVMLGESALALALGHRPAARRRGRADAGDGDGRRADRAAAGRRAQLPRAAVAVTRWIVVGSRLRGPAIRCRSGNRSPHQCGDRAGARGCRLREHQS